MTTQTCRRDLDLVANAPIREAFLRLHAQFGLTLAEVAVAAGWMRRHNHRTDGADSSRVARCLGLKPWPIRGQQSTRSHIQYETAVMLVRAMGIDPVDVNV